MPFGPASSGWIIVSIQLQHSKVVLFAAEGRLVRCEPDSSEECRRDFSNPDGIFSSPAL